VVTRILDGEVDLIVNTPFGAVSVTPVAGPPAGPAVGPATRSVSVAEAVRLDGYEIRTAAVRRGVPCVTTVAGLAAAVQGIEATIRGEIGVRSLQEHAAALRGN
jgi:carbamoyl-phosphate synthase large subunit